jgi:hypothetical protein
MENRGLQPSADEFARVMAALEKAAAEDQEVEQPASTT